MQFRNPEKEKVLQDSELNQTLSKLQSSQQLRKTKFNIISHDGPPRKIDLMPRVTKDKFGSQPFHILSNLPNVAHKTASLIYDEDYNINSFPIEPPKAVTPAVTSAGHTRSKPVIKKREFNIVSNKYFENEGEKLENEYEKLKNRVVDKYWEAHDYDIIKGKYFDVGKEKKFQEQKEVLKGVQGKAQELNYPPSIQYSEGHSYNIVNNDLYDDMKLQVTMTMQNRTLNRMTRDLTEARIKEEEEKKAELDEHKRMSRIKFRRWETELDRGYHAIKNEVLANPPMPLPTRPATMWARLNTEPRFNNNNGENHGITSAPGGLESSNGLPGRNSSGFPPKGSIFSASAIDLPPASGGVRNLSGGTNGLHNVANNKPFASNNQNQQQYESARNYTGRGGATDRSDMSNLSSVSGRMHGSYSGRDGYAGMTKSGRVIPSLDLTRAEGGEPVKYNIPDHAPPGLAIPMVRTGGLSGIRS